MARSRTTLWSPTLSTAFVCNVIKDGYHDWRPNREYDTSEAVWEFLEQHPMPE